MGPCAVCRFQKTGVTASILDAYRLPQLVQGWEWGLLRFLRARVTSEPPTCFGVMSAGPWPSCIAVLRMPCQFGAVQIFTVACAMGRWGRKLLRTALPVGPLRCMMDVHGMKPVACAAGGQSVWKALRSGYGQAERSQALRLKAAVAEHGIKVGL